jgi:hypothetical protein
MFILGLAENAALAQLDTQVAPVVTVVAIQSNEGLSESDMTPTFLKRTEEWSVNTSRKKMSQSLARSGQNPNIAYQVPISSQSLFNVVGGKKLMIIRMTVDNSIREVSILGFKGSEFYRIGCLRASNHDIPVFSGECGKVVKETFGVSIP